MNNSRLILQAKGMDGQEPGLVEDEGSASQQPPAEAEGAEQALIAVRSSSEFMSATPESMPASRAPAYSGEAAASSRSCP